MYQQEREELADICRRLYERRLVYACDGNISSRTKEGHILLTPSGRNKGQVTPGEILVLDLEGNTVWGVGRASKEYPMHRAVYQGRPDVNGVVHTHPVYVTAFALAGRNLPDNYLIEMRMMLKKTALAEYAAPGTEEMAQVISPYIPDHNGILLKNHGAVTLGKNLEEAFNNMEVMESIAKTVIMSRIMGDPVVISEENMAKMPM